MNKGKICISVCAATADELIGQIKRAENLADVVEIRFDCLEENQFDSALEKISNFKFEKPFLATFRPKDKLSKFVYGKFINKEAGQKQQTAFKDRINLWKKILSVGKAESLDFEDDLFFAFMMSDPFEKEIIQKYQIIFSYHDFSNEQKELNLEYELLSASDEFDVKCDIIKIAAQADDITDSIPIWQLLKIAKSENKQVIPIAMGESGKWTRILGLANGAPMTYAALDSGKETAPGQISARDLIEIYRAKELDEKTEIYGIIGGNTTYTMSPYMHNAVFKSHNLNSVFVPLQMRNVAEFIRRMVKKETREIELDFKGFSVTNPHKQEIIKHLDEVEESAAKIGAVNTVKITDGKLYGYNTDAQGFLAPLKNIYGDLQNARIALCGAGGAARACAYALKQSGANVTVFARDLKKAENLAEEFDTKFAAFKTAGENYDEFDILVNATPLGTKGEPENETVAVARQISKLKLVYDLIYNPLETRLLREADKAEVPKIGGLAMLVAQAAEQQKIWTGKDVPVDVMSRAALERLAQT